MRAFNFSAGPAAIPTDVLEQARAEMLDFQGTGMSVMEMSHRGKVFMAVAAEVEADFRALMGIPANYKVLFLQGGGKGEFSAVSERVVRCAWRGAAGAGHRGRWHLSLRAQRDAKRG